MLNTVILMGRLTADTELKVSNSGTEFCNFSVAVDRNYSGKNEEKKTDFIDVSAFRHTAVFINKYFKKGDMIAIQGSIQTDTYTDKDGKNRKSVKVIASDVSFCGGKKSATENTHEIEKMTGKITEFNEDDDTLPF